MISLGSDFHVVGEVFATVQPAGGGAVFELEFDEPGGYPFVTHAFRWADIGAIGIFRAG